MTLLIYYGLIYLKIPLPKNSLQGKLHLGSLMWRLKGAIL